MKWTIRLPVLCGIVVVADGLAAYSKPLLVPRCCPDGFSLDDTRSCTPDPEKPFHPVALVGDTAVTLNATVNQRAINISCEGEGQVLMYGSTNEANIFLLVDGRAVRLFWLSPNGAVIQQSQFCMARKFSFGDDIEPDYIAKFCFQDPTYQQQIEEKICAISTCVRKCCQPGEFMLDNKFCEPNFMSKEWKPTFMIDGEKIPPPRDLNIVYGHPVGCDTILLYDDHQLQPTGDILVGGLTKTHQEYCIEYNYDTQENSMTENALVCFKAADLLQCPWKHQILKPVLLSVSCVCLALTWFVYMWVSQLRTSTTGRCLIAFVSAIFVAFVTIMVLERQMDLPAFQCRATGYIGHFSILATFFWLNVMSFHIFSCLRSEKQEGTWVFLKYSIYAWGCPLVVVLVGMILDITQAEFIRPWIEPPSCWFYDNSAKWAYQYGIILFLLIVNIGFFIGSVRALKQKEQHGQVTGTPNYTISAWTYFKLFIIMGLLWITEIIVFETTSKCSVLNTIFDVINGLQGVYVFLVSVIFRKDLKVFHCGLPKLVPVCEKGEGKTDTQEASELVATPAC